MRVTENLVQASIAKLFFKLTLSMLLMHTLRRLIINRKYKCGYRVCTFLCFDKKTLLWFLEKKNDGQYAETQLSVKVKLLLARKDTQL